MKSPMICPLCGSQMNHHAEKVDYSGAAEELRDLVVVIIEIHACPNCGASASRPAENGAGISDFR